MYPYSRIRCENCGRFISTQNIGKFKFTPDTHFTGESNRYWCIECVNNRKEKENE